MYKVEAIVDKKFNNRSKKPLYLIKWQGFDSNQNTWEPIDHLSDYCMNLIDQFEQKLKTLENTDLNIQGNDTKDNKKRTSNKTRKRKMVRKNKKNFKQNKINIHKSRDSQKENESMQVQEFNDKSIMSCESNSEEREEQIQIRQNIEQLQMKNGQKKQVHILKQEQSQSQEQNNHRGLIRTQNYPIILNLGKSNESQQKLDQKKNEGQSKYIRSFQRFKSSEINQQEKSPLSYSIIQEQQLPSKIVNHQQKRILSLVNVSQQQMKQNPQLNLSRHASIQQKKQFNSSAHSNFRERIKREKIQVLGLRNSQGNLSFYVQVKNGRSRRLWKTHQQMLSFYPRELCQFYEKNIQFQ